jgi:hypothetical protein
MAVKKLGRGLIIAGVAGVLLSLLISLLVSGRENVRAVQILSIEISVILLALGAWLLGGETAGHIQPGKQLQDFAVRLMDSSVSIWVFTGFIIVYLLLFVAPMFLRAGLQMNYFTSYIPSLSSIGNDLAVMVDLIEDWVAGNQSPYTLQFYPPLTYIIFAPLLLIKEPLALYRFFTLFTFISYCDLTLALPLKIIDRKHLPLALLLFVTGLFSYGFQFELERGQYNVFTFLLCLTSIYIFHYHPRYRLLAYLLFSISVQLKLYPAIFIFMFVDDWRNWKSILLRFVGIGFFNLSLFFVMGWQTFWDFLRSVSAQVVNPSWIGVWNHSISSFVSVVKQDGLGWIRPENLRAFRQNAGPVEISLLLAFALLFISALVISYLRKKPGLDPYLLLACTIGALILPISYDYTLSILTAPMLLFLCTMPGINRIPYKLVSILLILGISIAYFAVLIPYNFRPYALHNSFPLLFIILILATILNVMRYAIERWQPVAERTSP